MVAPAKDDDDGTPHSVVVQIIPEEDNYEDDRFSIESSGGTRSSDGRSSVGDFDSSDEADTPHSAWKADSPKSPQADTPHSTWKADSPKTPLREAAEASTPPRAEASTPSSCRSEAQRQSPPSPAVSAAATPVIKPRPMMELPKREFEIELVKEDGQSLGLDVLQHEGGDLSVSRVKPGLVYDWGEQHPDRKVQSGDRILSVNGEEGTSSELVEKIKGTDKLRLVIRRTNEFDVCIKEKGKLGIDVGFTTSTMKILAVNDGGRAQEWNDNATVNQVRPGDHIVQVNGLRGKSEDLLKELKGSEFPMHLVMVRGSGPPSPSELAGTEDPPSPSKRSRSPSKSQQSLAGRQLTERTSANRLHQASQHQTCRGVLEAAKGTTSRSPQKGSPGRSQKEYEWEEDENEQLRCRREFTAVQVW